MSESFASIPEFRRGPRPLYTTASPRFLTKAWLSLCHDFRWHIIKSRDIARAMETSVGSAAKYRRIFDALGLIIDIPGRWNPDELDTPGYDGSAIEDRATGYSSYTDWSSENYPAEIIMKTKEPEALSDFLDGVAKVYVFRRTLPSDSPLSSVYNTSDVRFAHRTSPIGLQFFSSLELLHTYEDSPCISSEKESKDRRIFPVVALIEGDRVGVCERSEHPRCCIRGEMTISDIMEKAGANSQATAYRWANKLGTKIRKGTWLFDGQY